MGKCVKVLIGLTEIAGYGHSLCEGFLKQGISCKFICKQEHPFQYEQGKDNFLVKIVHFLNKKSNKFTRKQLFKKILWSIVRECFHLILFIWALCKYNVFIFLYNVTFLPKRVDVPILKFFHKKIIFIYMGSEVRPAYINGFVMSRDYNDIKRCITYTSEIKRRLKFIEKYADYVINYPPTAHFHERKFILGLIMGFPKQIQKEYAIQVNCDAIVRILHCPSQPENKGTFIIRQAIQSLRTKGYSIEYIEVIGQPNASVLKNLERCDFVVDQVYSDTPLAGFATEAAFFSKPAVVGGYYANYIQKDVPKWCIPPSEFVRPEEIEQAIEKLITDKSYRITLGEKAKHFAESYLAPEKVADRYLRLINDNVPNEWYYDPYNVDYLYGCGISEQMAKKLIAGVVQHEGVQALQLADKPKLEKLFLEFAGVESKKEHA